MASSQTLSDLYFLAKFPPESPLRGVGSGQYSSQKQKPSVLIVDDESLIADTLAEILNESGFDATAVYDGTTALEQARKLCPDAMITDVIMSDMNGIEVAKAVRDICADTRIFLLSGQAATTGLVERARSEGYSFELFAKPLHPELLLKKLRQ